MSSTVEVARTHGHIIAVGVVLAGALLARALLIPSRALAGSVVRRVRLRAARERLGSPVTPAFTPDDDGRSLTLDGTFVADGPRLRVGPVLVALGGAATVDAQDGERVLVRGTLRRSSDEAGAMFRDVAPPAWSIGPIGDRLEVARVLADRPHRASGLLALGTGAALALVALTAAGQDAVDSLRPMVRSLARVTRSHVTWQTRWDPRDELPLSVALCSPRHRPFALAHIQESLDSATFLTADEGSVRAAGSALVRDGRCAEATELYFSAGLLTEAANQGLTTCSEPSALALAWEAVCANGVGTWYDANLGRLRSDTLRRWLGRRPVDLRGPEVIALFAYENLYRHPSVEQVPADDSDPSLEALRCVERALLHPDTRPDERTFPGPAAWDDMLRSSSPACRIVAATRVARRDDASLRALDEIAPRASPIWRPLIDAARDLIVLDAERTGHLRGAPLCSQQEPYGEIDPARYARMPEVTALLIMATQASPCLWMVDRVRLPAQEAMLRFVRDTGGSDDYLNGASVGRNHYSVRFGAEWYAYAWQGYQMAIASRQRSEALDRRFDVRWGASLLEGLQRVRRDGVVLATHAHQHGGETPDPARTLFLIAGQRANIDPTPGFADPRAVGEDLQEHAAEMPAAFATVVAHAGPATPMDRVRVLLEAAEGDGLAGLRERAVRAATGGDTRALLAELGPPTADAVQVFADVAPLLTSHRSTARPWLRVAASYTHTGSMSIHDRQRLGWAIGRSRNELRDAMGDETTMTFALSAWRIDDPFTWAVVEALREEARYRAPAHGRE